MEAPTEPELEERVSTAPLMSGDAGLALIVGTAPPAASSIVSIITLESHAEIGVPLQDELPVMDQYGRQFIPTFLLVRKGQTINFTNSEDDLHTVHVKNTAGESLFNVATMRDSTYKFTFDFEGEYTVVCNTHTEMFADILVVDAPYAVLADRDGNFTVSGVVPGTYTAVLIYGETRSEQEIEVVAGRNEIDLTGG